MFEPAKPPPRWFTVLPIGATLALVVMMLTHRNFEPSRGYVAASAAPLLLATVWIANHLRRSLVGCVRPRRFGGSDDPQVFGEGRAWQQSLLVALLCMLALALFIDSFCNTVFGDTHFSTYVVTAKYIHEQRLASCDTLRITRLRGPGERHHVCVSAHAYRTIFPGQTLMLGEQTSWFGDEITSYRRITS